MRQAYDRLRHEFVRVNKTYGCRVCHKKCRRIFKHVVVTVSQFNDKSRIRFFMTGKQHEQQKSQACDYLGKNRIV